MDTLRFGRRQWLASALSLAGVGAGSAWAQPRPIKLRLLLAGAEPTFHLLPLRIADRRGFFAAEGLDVELRDAGGPAKAHQALADGSADVVAGAFESTLTAQAKSGFLTAFVLLGRAPQVALGVSVRALPAYKSAADLKGRRIGVSSFGSASDMVARLALAREGVPAQQVGFVELGGYVAAVAALRSGQVDAISHMETAISMLEQKGELRIVADTRALKGTQELFGGPMPAACLYATAAYLQKNAQTAQALANAVVRALKWLQTAGPSDIIKVSPESYFLGDRGLYLASFNKVRETIALDGLIPEEGARTALRTVAALDPAFKLAEVNLARSFTNDFAKLAKKRFGA